MKAKYVNPFTDFGFKKIFGEEASKPLLLDFLNALLPDESKIKDLSFKNIEHLGQTEIDRKSLFDIYCEAENGERFIVELQKAKQSAAADKERTIYYSTFPIRQQAERGEWNFNLKAVYCIGILDFTFDDYESDSHKKIYTELRRSQNEPERSEVMHTIQLKNQHGKVFYDKLTYIYLEMPNFKLGETALQTRLDKWLYFIKHLEDFQTIPAIFQNEVVFEQAFEKAELAKLDPVQYEAYERSMKDFRDAKNTFDYAVNQATEKVFDKGMAEGINKVAKALKDANVAIEIIVKTTGLSEAEIDRL